MLTLLLALAWVPGSPQQPGLHGAESTRIATAPPLRLRYDLATGEITHLGGRPDAGSDPHGAERAVPLCIDGLHSNDVIFNLPAGEEWLDFAAKTCGGTGRIGAIGFGYGTTVVDPAPPGIELDLSFYSGASTFCASTGSLAASFHFTGLPGHVGTWVASGYLVTAVLPPDLVFTLPDGPIAWGYSRPQGSPGVTGPFLANLTGFVPGWQNVLDRYNAAPAPLGTCVMASPWFCDQYPYPPEPCGGFVIELRELQPQPAAAVVRNAAPNQASFLHAGSDADGDCTADGLADGPMLGERWLTTVGLEPTHLVSLVAFARAPLAGGFPLGGAFGGTRILCLGVMTREAVLGTSHCVPIPLDPILAGASLCAQAGSIGFTPAPAVRLRNALDLVLGVR